MLEVYNELVRDLLHPETPPKSISIRENPEGEILVIGIRDKPVKSASEVMHWLELGSACRSTGATMMNEHSSRSHAILTVHIEQRETANSSLIAGKFHFVDLAGSERAKRTGATGARFVESVRINQGLLALGNVISALTEKKKGRGGEGERGERRHVPYRDSKLTRLLQVQYDEQAARL
jgi:hypothetical protein